MLGLPVHVATKFMYECSMCERLQRAGHLLLCLLNSIECIQRYVASLLCIFMTTTCRMAIQCQANQQHFLGLKALVLKCFTMLLMVWSFMDFVSITVACFFLFMNAWPERAYFVHLQVIIAFASNPKSRPTMRCVSQESLPQKRPSTEPLQAICLLQLMHHHRCSSFIIQLISTYSLRAQKLPCH